MGAIAGNEIADRARAGGSDPLIVAPSADLDAAVAPPSPAGCRTTAILHRRRGTIVHADIYDDFVDVRVVRGWRAGSA